jgi:D-beta-D-heptose 7-phosphate kinase/D-beta-D-heptose 1-phosphate adenosyltransferase
MMDLEELEALLGSVTGVSVLSVGDVMVDRFIYGDVTRVSAEAPIPVMARAHEIVMLGGCGNVARNVIALGGRADLVGVVGGDFPASEAHALVASEIGMGNRLVVDTSRPTTLKTRYVSAGQQLLRVDVESTGAVEGDAQQHLIDAITAGAAAAGAILISDYGKGVVTQPVIEACLAAARARGVILVVDSKARGFRHYGKVDVIKPNASELARATDLPTETDHQIEAALAKALEMSHARAILVTRAARGMSLAVRGEPVRHFSRPPPEVFDTSGAGDTALAALGLALAAGATFDQAVELALIASSVVVEKAGTATATPDDVLEAQAAVRRAPLDAKVASAARMAREAERWRKRGLKVGFTNGCFDILHPGHIAYLAQARSWCDRLIVGLNTDASVRASKGPGRPVNALESRARVLAGLSAVDLVVPFADETPLALIEAARPDLLVKGADYSLESVVGRTEVESWGGEVRLAAFMDGHSTTATIQRMAEQA